MFVKYRGNPAQIYQHPIPLICAQSGYEQTDLKPADFAGLRFLFKIWSRIRVRATSRPTGQMFGVQGIVVSAPGVYLPSKVRLEFMSTYDAYTLH